MMDDDDCDDSTASVRPGAPEVCNNIDDNCNGTIDESTAVNASTWYRDSDGDTYGNASLSQRACTQPSGYVSNSTDCDDTRAAVHPGANELCSTTYDDDCDGTINENSATSANWFPEFTASVCASRSSLKKRSNESRAFGRFSVLIGRFLYPESSDREGFSTRCLDAGMRKAPKCVQFQTAKSWDGGFME